MLNTDKKAKEKTVGFRLPKDEWGKLCEIAIEYGIKPSKLIRQIIRKFFAILAKKAENT